MLDCLFLPAEHPRLHHILRLTRLQEAYLEEQTSCVQACAHLPERLPEGWNRRRHWACRPLLSHALLSGRRPDVQGYRFRHRW